MTLVFVYGTLKRTFPLHEKGMDGAPYLGDARTAEPYPLYVAGPKFGPMMLDRPGEGVPVRGELYEVDEARLAVIDELESMGKPGHLKREIEVRPVGGGPAVTALAYPKAPELAEPRHAGPIEDYQDRRYVEG